MELSHDPQTQEPGTQPRTLVSPSAHLTCCPFSAACRTWTPACLCQGQLGRPSVPHVPSASLGHLLLATSLDSACALPAFLHLLRVTSHHHSPLAPGSGRLPGSPWEERNVSPTGESGRGSKLKNSSHLQSQAQPGVSCTLLFCFAFCLCKPRRQLPDGFHPAGEEV